MVIASHVAGRIRIRDDGLRSEARASRIREALLASDGVTAVETNRRIGSLLVLYSAALTAAEKILTTISNLLGARQERSEGPEPAAKSRVGMAGRRVSGWLGPRLKKNLVNAGMLASLLVSVIFAFAGLKKIHILTGVVFLLLFGDHVYQRKEWVFT